MAVHVVWFVIWVTINSGLTFIKPFDPFPFTLLTTIVSLEAIFLTLFVLASENRLTQDAERRGQLDLQVNLLAEQEMTMVSGCSRKCVSTWICGRRSTPGNSSTWRSAPT